MSKHAPPYPNAATDPFNQVPGMNRPPMTAEPDLLPCPFCGLDVTDDEGCFPLNREGTRWEVRCGNPSCFAHDPCDESMQAAVARWNRRATAAVDEAAAIRAFEEHFEASAEDPSFEGELELWLTAWRKALDSAPQRPAAVDRARFRKAPCYLCGYNGAGYFQPETHPCAALYHAAQPGGSDNG